MVSPDILRAARDTLPNPENSVETIAKLLGVSVGTLYNHIPDLKELRAPRIPAPLEGTADDAVDPDGRDAGPQRQEP
ncbi:hypothetical protein ACGF0D_42650 [Kitasatospora sp. NPDC048298]|uniref:hypothetical protein n=1 Tax=Kitasatospora sp. NPDC048298 TaxID=3364049 RepID=UPI003716D4D0